MTVNPKFQNKEIKKGLYIIPTPIGNLGDITYRAIEIFKKSDFILCEDTRISRKLMEKFEIKSKLLPNHKFNEKKNLSQIINHLRNDKIISLISDAGTPGISLVIGPVFHKNLLFLDKVKNITFLSLTNKTLDLHKNIISSGINSSSQLNTIKKFLEKNEIKKTIFLIPNLDYDLEIKKGIKESKIKFFKQYNYDIDPTKLTKQIEKITSYGIRKQNLLDEILRVENSDDPNKEKIIENLEKKYTLGKIKFDSVIITDFDESLKSVITSLLYTDVSPKNNYIITLNQWFDESLLKEINLQPIYYPSINKQNLDDFNDKFFKKFNYKPDYLSLLSYDLIGLIYYLSLKNESLDISKSFNTQNTFKGKIGVFEIKDNKINHQLNFYEINNGKLKEIF